MFSPATGKNTITLNANAFSNPTDLAKMLKNDFITGKSYDTDLIESLVAHEMGHNAHNALALKRAGIAYGKPLSPLQIESFKIEHQKIATDIYEVAFSDEGFVKIQDICVNELGMMVKLKPNELIAQSFGNYLYGNTKSSVARKIVKYFMKGLK